MRMMTIASGSSGNCIYIGSDRTHILIDAGISRKKIEEGLRAADVALSDIAAVFVTHEHSDHIKGLGVLSRKDEIPVYSTQGTISGILETPAIGALSSELFHPVQPDTDIRIEDLTIRPFSVSHDAREPVAYTVTCGQSKAGIATDLGFYDEYIVEHLKDSDALLIEANHDINLLQVGSYPYYLKQRILGNKGHLSNEASGRLINRLLSERVKSVLLGHLSKENNYDKLAFETVRCEIDMSGGVFKAADFNIEVAGRCMPSRIIAV